VSGKKISACRIGVALLEAFFAHGAGILLKVTYDFRNLNTKTIVLAISRMLPAHSVL
jgi:hypothetical protein